MTRSRRSRFTAVSVTLVLLGTPCLSPPEVGAEVTDAPVANHRPPVDAPVTDPFRPPVSPYGPGNRGLEYGTRDGDAVVASAAGTVSFAGPVGATAAITVRHDPHLRTTYTHLTEILVTEGDEVRQGQRIGRARPGFHFGARMDGVYFDPATLFGERVVRVRLVAVPGRAASGVGAPPARRVRGVP